MALHLEWFKDLQNQSKELLYKSKMINLYVTSSDSLKREKNDDSF